ncbi:MAG: hypothetical protein AVDCRST_MAG40-2735, partial [uncultured Gemmatimonadaceae bacterium]
CALNRPEPLGREHAASARRRLRREVSASRSWCSSRETPRCWECPREPPGRR